MSIENEINKFEFESLPIESVNFIKNAFNECYKDNSIEDIEELAISNADILIFALEDIVDKELQYPETFIEVLEVFENCKDIMDYKSLNILNLKRFNQLESYYKTSPFLVSIIELIYNNMDENINLEELFEELVDISKIIIKSI